MLVSNFDYQLPKELIAQKPIHPRDHSRLLVLNRRTGAVKHRHFYDLPKFLKRDDLLVFNNTKVFKARLFGRIRNYESGIRGEVEIFLLRPIDKYNWEVLAKPGKKLKEGGVISFGRGLICQVKKKKEEGVVIVKFNQPKEKVLIMADKIGHVPVPPYIAREPKKLADYQTIYAKNTGSVAAPTAGFHFTPRLFRELKKKGVRFAFVTLHVGLGTFRPVKTERVEEHEMHSEWVEIDKETAEMIKQAKKAGRRVIAVGTTTARVLEGVVKAGKLQSHKGDINIFIYPGYKFKIIDGLITNFHLPKSTLLMLVSAFVGREKILRAYQTAVKKKYRFFSFGDAMLVV
ncbi:MAG: tRNA preQ1(34) S-adenosylmethionine ribosyltransferase-isomerase QueA [Patescibacteria group bacterium]